MQNDRGHRLDGPAVINYREDGSISASFYRIEGEYVEDDDPRLTINTYDIAD